MDILVAGILLGFFVCILVSVGLNRLSWIQMLGIWVLSTIIATIALVADDKSLTRSVAGGLYTIMLFGGMLLNLAMAGRILWNAFRSK